jgi:hypothetical protein
MADDNVRTLNQRVNTNLDELERDSKPKFAFVLAGNRVEMLDPAEIDFKDLMTIEHPANFLKFALTDDAKKVLSENKLEGWKFNQLIKDYMEYYDLDPNAMGKDWLS